MTSATSVPFRITSYPATPTLSFDAVQPSIALVWVTFDAFKPVGVVGGCVSAHAVVEAITVACCDRFPAASTASTDKV